MDDNPNWYEDNDLRGKMVIALQILRIACPNPAECTDDEYEFVMHLCKTLNEVS